MPNKEKLKEIFLSFATPEEKLAYQLKEAKKKLAMMEALPPKVEIYKGDKGEPGDQGAADTGKQIVEKVNLLAEVPEEQIDFKHIKNFPWNAVREALRRASGDQHLVNWGSNLNMFETPTGTINSANVTFTVVNTPKAVILNGVMYFENDGYTLSDLTITMLIVPMTGSTLRSLY